MLDRDEGRGQLHHGRRNSLIALLLSAVPLLTLGNSAPGPRLPPDGALPPQQPKSRCRIDPGRANGKFAIWDAGVRCEGMDPNGRRNSAYRA